MNWLNFFRRAAPEPGTAQTAKERLQILLAHERQDRTGPDYLPLLQKDLIEVIRKYVPIANEKVAVKLERGADMSTLAIDIELPGPKAKNAKVSVTRPKAAFAR